MNCKSIIFGNHKIHQGNVVSDDQVIHWTNSKQRIIVKNTTTQQEYKIDRYCLKDKNVKTLKEIINNHLYTNMEDNRVLIRDEHLGKRGTLQATHYSNYEYLLMDTLHFEAFGNADHRMKSEAVWYNQQGENIVTSISRTPDGRFYIVTPAIYHGEKPQDVKLTIREVNSEQNWVNHVYKDISIVYIPQYIGKKHK